MRTMLIKSTYLETYKKRQPITISKHLAKLKDKEPATDFGYRVTESCVYSSMIEGNPIDLETYLKYRDSGMNTKTKSYKEIEDLQKAYEFARKNPLNLTNLLKAHGLLTKQCSTLDKKYKGAIREINS